MLQFLNIRLIQRTAQHFYRLHPDANLMLYSIDFSYYCRRYISHSLLLCEAKNLDFWQTETRVAALKVSNWREDQFKNFPCGELYRKHFIPKGRKYKWQITKTRTVVFWRVVSDNYGDIFANNLFCKISVNSTELLLEIARECTQLIKLA